MGRVWQYGYSRDIVRLFVVTIIVGSVLAWGAGWIVDSFFGDTVHNIVGDVGEYDVILQVRDGHGESTQDDLHRIMDRHLPGSTLREGVSIAGQTYYFLKLAPDVRNAHILTQIPQLFQPVSGYIGHSLLLEPSISIQGVHDAIVPQMMEFTEHMPDVDFTFRNGSNYVVVLKDPEALSRVQKELTHFLESHHIIDVRLPLEAAVGDDELFATEVASVLRAHWGEEAIRTVQGDDFSDEADEFMATLAEIRSFLLNYVPRVVVPDAFEFVGQRIRLVSQQVGVDEAIVQLEGTLDQSSDAWGYVVDGQVTVENGPWFAYATDEGRSGETALGMISVTNARDVLASQLDESIRTLQHLDHLSSEAENPVQQIAMIRESLDEAIGYLHTAEHFVMQLQQHIGQLGESESTTALEALASVLISNWLKRLANQTETEAETPNLLNIDTAAIEETLRLVVEGIAELTEIDLQAVIAEVEQLRQSLPVFDGETMVRAIRLLDDNLADYSVPGERITLQVTPDITAEDAETVLRRDLGEQGIRVVRTASGIITPDARTTLAQVLGQVRELVTVLVAFIIVLVTLFLDHSVLLSMEAILVAGETNGKRGTLMSACLGAVSGSVLLTLIAFISGGKLPFVGWPGIILIGAAAGLLIGVFATRMSPIDEREVVAGRALGLQHKQIMREIVVPSGRPGLLTAMNRLNQHFV